MVAFGAIKTALLARCTTNPWILTEEEIASPETPLVVVGIMVAVLESSGGESG